jgi:hypothetical protein
VIDFYRTAGGRRFIDATVPDLVLQIQRVANALDRLVELAERATKEQPPARSATPLEGS